MVEIPKFNLDGFHQGERDVLTEVYRQHVAGVERAVSCFCRGVEAECIVHEVFLHVLERPEVRRQFTGGDLGAWLNTIARRRAIDRLRRDHRWTFLDDPRSLEGQLPAIDEEESMLHRDQLRHLGLALERFSTEVLPQLDEKLVQVFRLRLRERASQVDAARDLNIPRSTLIEREQRLMNRLGSFLRRYFSKEPA